MEELYDVLVCEKKKLLELESLLKKEIKDAPEGKLRISQCRNTRQYYLRTEETKISNPQGQYIKKKDLELAKQIAQRDYDMQVLDCVQEKLKKIDRLIFQYEKKKEEDIYEGLNVCRKEIVLPRILTNAEYAKRWNEVEYVGKTFEEGMSMILSNKGERVRSKSEKIIADMLDKRKIFYRYEAPLVLQGIGTIYPDFTILNVRRRTEIYWEHLGMMDNKDYCEAALRRIEMYQRNGIMLGERLIITYETAKYPLETEMIERNIREFCMA